MVISQLAMPVQAASCPEDAILQPEMSCCGPTCPCPVEKACAALPSIGNDRSIGQTQREIFTRVALPLFLVNFRGGEFSAESVKLKAWDTKPPPLSAGGSPRATLCVWIL